MASFRVLILDSLSKCQKGFKTLGHIGSEITVKHYPSYPLNPGDKDFADKYRKLNDHKKEKQLFSYWEDSIFLSNERSDKDNMKHRTLFW